MLKEDGFPIEVVPHLYIGSMGTAFSKDNLIKGMSMTLRKVK